MSFISQVFDLIVLEEWSLCCVISISGYRIVSTMMLRHFFNLKALFFYFALATTSVSVVGSVILGHNTTNNTLVSDDNLSGDSDGPLLNNNTDVTDGITTNKSDGNGFDRMLETDGSNGFLSKHSSNLESLAGMKEENGLIEEKKNKSFPCM